MDPLLSPRYRAVALTLLAREVNDTSLYSDGRTWIYATILPVTHGNQQATGHSGHLKSPVLAPRFRNRSWGVDDQCDPLNGQSEISFVEKLCRGGA